jgi:ornithine cyclodeaminase/alanine dehydrogenase-like protein (mu-crystallin family)
MTVDYVAAGASTDATRSLGAQVLYLRYAEMEGLGIAVADVIAAVEGALRELGMGQAVMPAKTRLTPDSSRYYSAMPCVLPAYGLACVKWNAIFSTNPARGLPFITGLMLVNDDSTGLPIAILDSGWVTAYRTGAASAVTAKHLIARDLLRLGIVGCGVQGRTHAVAMHSAFPSLREISAFDVSPTALARYQREMEAALGIKVTACDGPRDVLRGAQAVVTATPTTSRDPVLQGEWLEPGQLIISIDYDCYWNASGLDRLDAVFTDDVAQFEKSRQYGYYATLTRPPKDLAAAIAGRAPSRTSEAQIIGAFNAGVAVEDLATARLIIELARARGAGTLLPL